MQARLSQSALPAARVVVGTLLLGSAALVAASGPGGVPVGLLFGLAGLTYGVSLAAFLARGLVVRRPWLLDVQLWSDALVVTAFVHLTGGITSYFTTLYVLPIIAASTIRFRGGALRVAGWSAVLYALVVLAQYARAAGYDLPGGVAQVESALPGVRFAQVAVATNLLGFIAVALLAGSLAERLRAADARLDRASHQIKDLRAFTEVIVDSLPSGLVTTDMAHRVLTFNRAAATITGIAPERALDLAAADLFQLSDVVREELARLEGRVLRTEIPFITASGRHIEVGLSATIIGLPEGGRGCLFTFQDITDIRRRERNARRQERLAALGEMAAGIAHEIRNPLASMSGSIQVLRQELPLGQDHAQLFDIVLRESERLDDTIGSFLAYARPQRLPPVTVDVGRAAHDVAAMLGGAPECGPHHRIEVDVPTGPVPCEIDERQLRQVLWNLGTNGLRAMTDGGTLRLGVGTGEVDAHPVVVLTVTDTGSGIPAQDLDGIFQPFRSRFPRGMGLGLAVVHRLVTEWGGAIQVASDVGRGTTMEVRLPARAADTQEQAAAPVVARAAS
ncbi:MAG: nitrogen regulation protein NR(II) [Vicinamibacterales bacterium]